MSKQSSATLSVYEFNAKYVSSLSEKYCILICIRISNKIKTNVPYLKAYTPNKNVMNIHPQLMEYSYLIVKKVSLDGDVCVV